MGLETGKEPQGGQEVSQEEVLLALKKELEEVRALKKEMMTSQGQGYNTPANGLAAEIAQAFKQIRQDSKELDYRAGIRADQIPKDDILEVPVVFFAPCVGTMVYDDNKNGMPVNAPYNAEILFEYVATRKMGHGKDTQTIPLSRYKCTSKAICEFLRNHSNYGVKFYESANNLDENTLRKASRTSEIISVVKDYTIDQLMSTCKQYGVPFSDNYQAMKGSLAMAMAERELEREMAQQKALLEETQKRMMVRDGN